MRRSSVSKPYTEKCRCKAAATVCPRSRARPRRHTPSGSFEELLRRHPELAPRVRPSPAAARLTPVRRSGRLPPLLAELVGRHNARQRLLIDAERAALLPLPAHRVQDFEREPVLVTSHSGFTLRRVFYSVPSRLIGHRLAVYLFADRLVLSLGASELLTLRTPTTALPMGPEPWSPGWRADAGCLLSPA